MDKPIVMLIHEMKDGIYAEVNKYVNQIPATIILDTIDNIKRQLVEQDKIQLQQALKDYKESEGKSDGQETNNSVANS